MKNIFSITCILVVFILFESCKKNADAIKKDFSTPLSLAGKWELRRTLSQVGVREYSVNNHSVLEFTDSTYSTTDTAYSIFLYGSHHSRGFYKIIYDSSVVINTGLPIPTGQFTKRIVLDNDTISEKIFYQISNKQLVILSGYFPLDGGIRMTYEKK